MKKFLLLAIAAIFATKIFAQEYGALLSSNTDLKFNGNNYKQPVFEQSETLAPFIKIPFNKTTSLSIEATIQHKLNTVFGAGAGVENALIVDLSLLKFTKIVKLQNASSLEFSLGRMFTSDSTENIFAQTNDGFLLKYNSQIIEFGIYGGYSGLLNIKNIDMLSSGGEKFISTKEKPIYDFSAPYIIAAASIVAPYLFADQTLSFELLDAIPTKGPAALPSGEQNRFYATLSLNGNIAAPVYYSVSATAQTNNFKQGALFAKFALAYYAPFKDATIGLNAAYASGNNGALSPFVAVTKQKSCLSAQELPYSGILKMGLSASILAIPQCYIALNVDTVFNTMKKAEYYGFQAALLLQYQPFSDLKFALGASTFAGKDSANNRTEIGFNAAIAF